MHYYRFNIPDWTLHTAHLSPEEEGVYFRLVNFYYDTEHPIPEETQSVIRRLRLGSHMETVSEILAEFFTLKDGEWHHKRCDLELEAYHAKAEQNRLNGRRGGRPSKSKTQKKPKKTQSVISGNPNETLTNNHKPLTNNQLIKTPSPENEAADRVITALNQQAGKRYRLTENNRKPIKARMADGFTEADCLHVVANRVSRWKGTEQDEYLRPETLFRQRNFEGYLNDNGERDGRTGRNPEKHSQPTVADKLRGRLANMQ